uniref:NET domain-containing protein n=1 Tax=viral metagenome TaxID=1070528 RepID=A0A6C0H8D6_9ZZZZ
MDIIKKHRKYNTEIRKKINSDLHKIKDEHFMQQIYNLIIEDIGHNYSKNINGIFINLNILSDFCIDKLINTLEEYSKYSKHDKNKKNNINISNYKFDDIEIINEMGHKLSNQEKLFIKKIKNYN